MSLDADSGAPEDETIDEDLVTPEAPTPWFPQRSRLMEGGEGDDIPEEVEETKEPPPTELTDEERQMMRTVMTIGRLRKRVFIFDHPFDICTPCTEDELWIATFMEPYQNTQFAMKAYRAAVACVAIEKVDGKPLYTPLSDEDSYENNLNAFLNEKAKKVVKWHSSILDEVYEATVKLETRFAEIKKILGKRPG